MLAAAGEKRLSDGETASSTTTPNSSLSSASGAGSLPRCCSLSFDCFPSAAVAVACSAPSAPPAVPVWRRSEPHGAGSEKGRRRRQIKVRTQASPDLSEESAACVWRGLPPARPAPVTERRAPSKWTAEVSSPTQLRPSRSVDMDGGGFFPDTAPSLWCR
ncbi:hypothetical protein SEVIR_6G182900v4 [Setaria viridis]|uniref:Uncharacterized protein n=1 Tax=Setaria viridis TaxID=4556 RepID=A0A4U6U4X6_SETVI|nr:hypothetical protein SEVIR_6G182900v2 [Setaria viridis]